MIKIFSKIFHINSSSNQDINNYIQRLEELSNGFGEYANIQTITKEIEIKGNELLSQIEQIEELTKSIIDSKLSYALAIAYHSYCSWYKRGDEQKYFLEKSLLLLNKSIAISPNNEAKAELGHLLIEKKAIRNLDKGVELLEELNQKNQMPSYLNSTLSKAKRQLGEIKNDTFNLCIFQKDPSPAVFSEERKRFRALVRQYKKEDKTELLKTTLTQYYNLSILVTLCYGNHNCNSAVSGNEYNEAVQIVNKVCEYINFSFLHNGIIINSEFISNNDWKTFIKIFGENNKKFNPQKEIQLRG